MVSTFSQNPKGPPFEGSRKRVFKTLHQGTNSSLHSLLKCPPSAQIQEDPMSGRLGKGSHDLVPKRSVLQYALCQNVHFLSKPKRTPFRVVPNLFKTLSQGIQFFITLFIKMSTCGPNPGGPSSGGPSACRPVPPAHGPFPTPHVRVCKYPATMFQCPSISFTV